MIVVYSLVLSLLVFLDLYSKHAVSKNISENSFLYITSFFKLVHVKNKGISFGFLSFIPSIVLAIIAISLVIYIGYLFLKTKNSLEKTGYILIISGAIGNIYDRIVFHEVTDFILFHCNGLSFPAFNFADTFITVGVTLILFVMIRNDFLKNKKALLMMLLILSSCDYLKKSTGLGDNSPDEFLVQRYEPLKIPNSPSKLPKPTTKKKDERKILIKKVDCVLGVQTIVSENKNFHYTNLGQVLGEDFKKRNIKKDPEIRRKVNEESDAEGNLLKQICLKIKKKRGC